VLADGACTVTADASPNRFLAKKRQGGNSRNVGSTSSQYLIKSGSATSKGRRGCGLDKRFNANLTLEEKAHANSQEGIFALNAAVEDDVLVKLFRY
jgi:hypothetical protein